MEVIKDDADEEREREMHFRNEIIFQFQITINKLIISIFGKTYKTWIII